MPAGLTNRLDPSHRPTNAAAAERRPISMRDGQRNAAGSDERPRLKWPGPFLYQASSVDLAWWKIALDLISDLTRRRQVKALLAVADVERAWVVEKRVAEESVVTLPAEQGVVAEVTDEGVVPVAALNCVVPRTAEQINVAVVAGDDVVAHLAGDEVVAVASL